MSLAQNLDNLRAELAGTKTKLLVVSKNQSAESIRTLYHHGQRDFGENRVQELEEKDLLLQDLPELRWHLIGHLQTNKIPKLKKVTRLTAIHSLDTLPLVEKVLTSLTGQRLGLFLEVNTSGEDEKHGFEDEQELLRAAELILKSAQTLQGLMTMGTIRTDDPVTEARRCFGELARMRDNLLKKLALSTLELSMGMSGDYLIARDMGSSWIRVGSKIFT